MTRTIREIAKDIRADWKKPYFGAVPYIDAMQSLESVKDNYYADSAENILLYFLANAGTWRGEKAKEIKNEIKKMLVEYGKAVRG